MLLRQIFIFMNFDMRLVQGAAACRPLALLLLLHLASAAAQVRRSDTCSAALAG